VPKTENFLFFSSFPEGLKDIMNETWIDFLGIVFSEQPYGAIAASHFMEASEHLSKFLHIELPESLLSGESIQVKGV